MASAIGTSSTNTSGAPGTDIAGIVLAAAVRRTTDNTPTTRLGIGQTHDIRTPTALAATRAAAATPASSTPPAATSVITTVATQLNDLVTAVHSAITQIANSISSTITTAWTHYVQPVLAAAQFVIELAKAFVQGGIGAVNSTLNSLLNQILISFLSHSM